MKTLTAREMNIVAGGSTPELVCSTSGDATHSEKICQTSSGLTTITTQTTVDVGGGFSLSGLVKGLVGVEGDIHYKETTTQTSICTADLKCKDLAPVVTKEKVGDLSDGTEAQNIAFDDAGGELGDSDQYAGGSDDSGAGHHDDEINWDNVG
jgi:hypothetical protein